MSHWRRFPHDHFRCTWCAAGFVGVSHQLVLSPRPRTRAEAAPLPTPKNDTARMSIACNFHLITWTKSFAMKTDQQLVLSCSAECPVCKQCNAVMTNNYSCSFNLMSSQFISFHSLFNRLRRRSSHIHIRLVWNVLTVHDARNLITTITLFTACKMCTAVQCNASTSVPSPTWRRTHIRPAAVHLQCTDGGDQHHDVGLQARGTTFDVEELLHPDVCSEPSFGHWK